MAEPLSEVKKGDAIEFRDCHGTWHKGVALSGIGEAGLVMRHN